MVLRGLLRSSQSSSGLLVKKARAEKSRSALSEIDLRAEDFREIGSSSKFFALNFFEIERRKINRSDKNYERARAKIKLRARRKTSNPAMIFALLNIALFGTNTPTQFLYG